MEAVQTFPAGSLGEISWRESIDSVGTEMFPRETIRVLDRWAGVEHYAAFDIHEDEVKLLSAGSVHGADPAFTMASKYAASGLCHRDPTLEMARQLCRRSEMAVLRLDPARLVDWQLRHDIYFSQNVCDRLFVCGLREGRSYGLSLLRTVARGAFPDPAIACIQTIADTLLSLVVKHQRMLEMPDPSPMLLRPVTEIEQCVAAAMPTLTRREAQVCARILRGMSTPGIAIDLGVREDSVATYRKRAYRRLEIGTRFELLQLFIGSCASAATTRH
ncbi:MAG: helix-turn-helix transcriptional regulator [Burkholderiales bacterium]|nr:helix-turn-helix transcriptional regulator [Burkholderiales bacterium]